VVFWGVNFGHLATTTKSIATRTKDFCEKNVAKSPDFKEFFHEIDIVRQ
jgi:hypothetical protein